MPRKASALIGQMFSATRAWIGATVTDRRIFAGDTRAYLDAAPGSYRDLLVGYLHAGGKDRVNLMTAFTKRTTVGFPRTTGKFTGTLSADRRAAVMEWRGTMAFPLIRNKRCAIVTLVKNIHLEEDLDAPATSPGFRQSTMLRNVNFCASIRAGAIEATFPTDDATLTVPSDQQFSQSQPEKPNPSC